MHLGASLVVTGRTDRSLSRRSWPVWLGLALIVLLVATSSTFGLGGALNQVSFGDKAVAVSALPRGVIHGGFGDLTVDLHGTTLGAGDQTLKVVSVAGRTMVDLPVAPDYNISVEARLAAGQICVDGQDVGHGVGPEYHNTLPGGAGSGSPTLTLDVHQMAGQILIGGQGCSH
jgi:hypothetical protein